MRNSDRGAQGYLWLSGVSSTTLFPTTPATHLPRRHCRIDSVSLYYNAMHVVYLFLIFLRESRRLRWAMHEFFVYICNMLYCMYLKIWHNETILYWVCLYKKQANCYWTRKRIHHSTFSMCGKHQMWFRSMCKKKVMICCDVLKNHEIG